MNHNDWILTTSEATEIGITPLMTVVQDNSAEEPNHHYLYQATPSMQGKTMVQHELFELDPTHFDLRQSYFDRLPLALADYFGRAYKNKLKTLSTNDTADWFKREMAIKMPRIQAVLDQYCDVFTFLRQGQQDLTFLAELDEDVYFEAGVTTEQAVKKIKKNAERLGVKFPMHISRLENSGRYLKQHGVRPIAYQSKEQIQEIALAVAYQLRQLQENTLAQTHHKAVDSDTAFAVLLDCYRQMQAKVNELEIDAPYQRKAKKGNITPEELETGFLKMVCEKWWARKLSIIAKRMKEHLAIACGMVNTLRPYCSNARLREFTEQRKANIEYIRAMIITNIAEPEEQLSLFDSWLKSASNPKIKRLELLTRMNGYEKYADEQGHEGWFITLTAPSKYHAMLSKTGNINPKWNGASPLETQKYLVGIWAKIRAKLNREGVQTYGFRVAEPHADATPHWHLILFTRPEDMDKLRQIILSYALAQDGTEAGAKKYRCKFKRIDKKQGTATGYLIKYVSKNIDGFGMDGDLSDEANISVKENAAAVQAWSTLWGIRQFQQLGNTPVSVWRELRRLGDMEIEDEQLEALRQFANEGDWQGFTQTLGGALVKRADLFARLVYAPRIDENGNAAYTMYKEESLKVNGLINPFTGARVTTRLKDWKIGVKPRNWDELQQQKKLANATPEEKAKIKATQLEKLGFNAEAQALLGDLIAPWTCVSNCTGLKNVQISEQERNRLRNELLVMRGRITEQQIDDLLNGKSLPLGTFGGIKMSVTYSRGRLIEHKEYIYQ
ncbi:replication endonuclease [Actinobacillus porcitonsillarum]|uniref:Replication endonuclease n=1 Tax=Actinobacillus porcitonsillarum TaxID=189834 RepID=A0A2U8FK87_9PAST|nr:replication endonuclease [Actinobacillus porcitonsillarum]AWI51395.1 replication endonuclease [Actinobacillus porcitonsillarum]